LRLIGLTSRILNTRANDACYVTLVVGYLKTYLQLIIN